jgi:hypothetical protein
MTGLGSETILCVFSNLEEQIKYTTDDQTDTNTSYNQSSPSLSHSQPIGLNYALYSPNKHVIACHNNHSETSPSPSPKV